MESPLKKYSKEKRIKELECNIPEVLYHAAAVSELSSYENLLKTIADNSEGAVKEEFNNAYLETKRGKSFQNAVAGIIKRNPSELIERTLGFLSASYDAGADSSSFLQETADEITKMHEVANDQAAGLAIERYTVILSVALIIPLVLGLLTSVIQDISSSMPEGFSQSSEVRDSFFSYSLVGTEIYLVIMGVIGGFFASYQSNHREKTFVYSAGLCMSSLALFNFVVFL